jgi:mRNA-degrading endonuclease HigB of HigAB toxin-antitoxin module
MAKRTRSQYGAWLDIVTRAEWRNPEDVKACYPKASILKAGRVVFNIKGNDYRLIARVQYQASVLMIRFFGTERPSARWRASRLVARDVGALQRKRQSQQACSGGHRQARPYRDRK